MGSLLYPGLGILSVTVLFSSWLIHRWLRQRRLSRNDALSEEIEETLSKRAEDKGDCLKRNPRESVNEIFKFLSSLKEEDREDLLNYLEIIDFTSVVADTKIRERKTDYSLLVVAAALGLEKGWRTSIKWLDKPGTWQWTAAIHALSYWPGRIADQVLIGELVAISERYQVVDRAFNQPIVGALKRRGRKSQFLALDYLTPSTPSHLQVLVLMFLKEVKEFDSDVKQSLENRLTYLWPDAGDEVKAKILMIATQHGLTDLIPMAKEAFGEEADFVQLWAVRLIARISPKSSSLEQARKEGSSLAKKEVEELSAVS